MNSAARDLEKLSGLGHFLKGSSAAIGVIKVQAICEKIQHYGNKTDIEHHKPLTEEDALDKIKPLLITVKKDYATAEKWLKNYFGPGDPPSLDA